MVSWRVMHGPRRVCVIQLIQKEKSDGKLHKMRRASGGRYVFFTARAAPHVAAASTAPATEGFVHDQ